MDVAKLCEKYPHLYHMAAGGSWASIQEFGLMTTTQQVARCSPDQEVKAAILNARRRQIYWLEGPDGRRLSVRDQKPLFEHNLVLEGTDLQGWLDILNGRVFFWVTLQRVETLLNARAYRDSFHDVLTLDTRSLVSDHLASIRLAGINTGATIFPTAPKRGPDTFQTIDAFNWSPRPRPDGSRPVVELAVLDGVPDVIRHVVSVHHVHRGTWTPLPRSPSV